MSKKKKDKPEDNKPEDKGGSKPRRVEDFLDDILGNGPRGTDGLLSQLAQRPTFGMGIDRRPAAPTPIRKQPQPPRTNPFEGLPEIPGISPDEQRARVLLSNILSEEMYKMIGAWLVVDKLKMGENLTDEVMNLQQQLAGGETTRLCLQDAWKLGFPIIQKLSELAKKEEDVHQLEQQLAAVFAQCRFDITWHGRSENPLLPENRLQDFT